ncbi:MAG TPA: glycosyltransferase family 2 protein, partial [Candidatus Angelobacter sp.]|nr:glycosyltransferase family 2 protein [Candidatus Angelobacter sp.]
MTIATPLTISVVIPVLNERENLPATIAALHSCRGISQIIVADGGSADGTLEWLQSEQAARHTSQPTLTVINAPRGKGPQVNAGASTAVGDVLLFLHADCLITQAAVDALQSALADPAVCGGGFYLRFAEPRPRSLRLVSWGINIRARARHSATGDQGIFLRRKIFHAIGGAPDWPL